MFVCFDCVTYSISFFPGTSLPYALAYFSYSLNNSATHSLSVILLIHLT